MSKASNDLRKVKSLVDKWKDRLGLNKYFIDVMICDDNHIYAQRDGASKIVEESETYAEVIIRELRTGEFSLVINRFALKKDLEDTIVHELLHIFMWEFLDIYENILPLLGLSKLRQAELVQVICDKEHELIEKLIKAIK